MDVACYLYTGTAVNGTLNLIRRICQSSEIRRIAFVFHSSIPLEKIVTAAQRHDLHNRCHYVRSEGKNWEFEAYQRGLDELSPCTRGLIVINDTAARNYPFFAGDLRRFLMSATVGAASGHPVVVGKIESRGCSFSLMGNHFQRWVRSNIFYINCAGLSALKNLIYDDFVFQAPRYVGGCLTINLPHSDNLGEYLLHWLSPAAGKSGWLQHSDRRNAGETVLRGKLGSILLEKHLSARLEVGGCEFLTYEPAVFPWWYKHAVRLFFKRRRFLGLISQKG